MHQTLVERGLCLRQPTDKGNLLVFPGYYRRERPEQVGHPAVLVSYRFADFWMESMPHWSCGCTHRVVPSRMASGATPPISRRTSQALRREADPPRAGHGGAGSVVRSGDREEKAKITFSKYVHEHLLQQAPDVERLRHYVCPHCGTPVEKLAVAMEAAQRLAAEPAAGARCNGLVQAPQGQEGRPTIICVGCEQRVSLWDEMEECFASPEVLQRVRDMQEESAIVRTTRTRKRAGRRGDLHGGAGRTNLPEFSVSATAWISRSSSRMTPTKQRARSFIRTQVRRLLPARAQGDGGEIFTIRDERHARYWMAQMCPVLLVIRNAEGEVRWMEERELAEAWRAVAAKSG